MTDNNQRDERLGAALRALTVDDSRDGFWGDVERELHHVDLAAQAESAAQPVDLGAPATSNGARPRAGQRWNFSPPKIMAVAAAVLLVVGGFVWALRPQADDTTELQVASQEETTPDADPATGEDAAVADSSDATVTSESEDAPTPPDAVGAGAPLDLAQMSGQSSLPLAMRPVAGSDTTAVVLYSWNMPSTEGFGCEGLGSRQAFVALDGHGVQVAPMTGSAIAPTVVEGPGDQIAISEWCEGDVQAIQVGSFAANGEITIERWLLPPEGFFFSRFDPVWSHDGEQLLMHLMDGAAANGVEEVWLGIYDADSGEVEVEPAVNRVLAQLTERAYVTLNPRGVFVGERSVLELDVAGFDADIAHVAVSTDGAHIAVAVDDVLIVTGLDSETHRFEANGRTIWSMDWSPTGQLIFSVQDGPTLYSYDVAQPGEFSEAFALEGDWFELEFADGGKTLAVFGTTSADPDQTITRILRVGVEGAVAGSLAGTPPPFGTTEVTVGEQPLALRGIGVIQSGMTVAEAEAATGGKLVEFAALDGCAHALLAGDPNSPSFMVTTYSEDGPDLEWSEGTIVRIELGRGATTLSGIGIGSTKAEVLAAYGDRIEVTPHNYTWEEGGEYLTFVPLDEEDSGFRLVMETFDDEVTAIRSGLTGPVQWVEGCA